MKFNKVLKNLSTYEAGKPIELVVREYGINPKEVVKLASNENPYGTSPKVVTKIKSLVKNMYLYPDDSMFELKEALASKFELNSKNVIIGSGSDQILEFAIHAKCKKGSKVLMAKTTFAMYEIYAKQVDAQIVKTKSSQHNLKEFSKLYKKHGADIIFLCIPNNPLGECLDKDEVYEFLKTIDKNTLVVVDGAYQEYASFKDEKKKICPKELINTFPNAIYLGTFSKAYALGGMRVGYGFAQEEIISTFYKIRAPFNITTLSLAAAIEALKDEEFVQACIEKNFIEMKKYEEYCQNRGFEFIPSYTNFITILLKNFISKEVSQKLLEKGMIIRDLTGYGLNAIRVTIGTEEQNIKLFTLLDEVLEELK
ncbi:histidinol-phosphate transaminase [Aliarcobacter trophiarum LMG 25534]|uniref:Histidinol-phosphate aminotransferase n=1 Tax=Aliarcobacter trophiarum LMG 25534 TaxID=1032241 RepID=A0AAD0QI47_9BACT|nr:histidinol-phosphate transaminase [Aliarcobacter trophiarum]AXK48161.1 histidinol-phosphate aminotransferase [Aliarcobacter trophiarum LMG 25534]RXJ93164.1 histidinol-phosphate transaminase [Aliarcobacter trophiarum LMG 25534]